MKKTFEKKNHWKKIIMHLKRHHKKYLFGAFGWFAIVKMVLLFFWLSPIGTFAQHVASERPTNTWVILNSENFGNYCTIDSTHIVCAGTDYNQYDIVWIEPWTFNDFSGTVEYIELSGNKITNIDSWIFNWLWHLHELHLSNNEIYDIIPEAFSWYDNQLDVFLENNCIPDSVIWKLERMLPNNVHIGDHISPQYVCLYVEYDEIEYTSGNVIATLSFTWNDDLISDYVEYTEAQNLPENPSIEFGDNDRKFFSTPELKTVYDNWERMTTYNSMWLTPNDILINFPKVSNPRFPAEVYWIDRVWPNCSDWLYEPENLDERATWFKATITGCTDTWAWVDITWSIWECDLTEQNVWCIAYIRDKIWNLREIQSASTNYIDTEKPIITISPIEWLNNSFYVDISVSDNESWVRTGSSIKYKWQTWSECEYWEFSTKALNDISHSTTVNTDPNSNDWTYYLCVKENSVFDNAWNWNRAEQAGPFILDNTAPICERSGLSTNSLEIWDTGNITLKCIDTWAWIQTMNLTSGDISFSGLVLRINNITTWSITDGIMYGIEFTAIGSWTTTLTLKTNRVKDNADNWNIDWSPSDEISVSDNGNNHGSPENLVYFIDQPDWNWTWHQYISIVRTGWATWCLRYSTSNNIFDWCDNGNYSWIYTDDILNEEHNNKYICAFWQSWTNTGFVCSQGRIFVDTHNPEIELTWPANWTSGNLWDTITLTWSGHDDESGIDEYELTIKKPNNTEKFYYNSWVTSTWVIVDQTWTRKWSIKAYDKVSHDKSSDEWNIIVAENNGWSWNTPVPGTLVSFWRQPDWNWTDEETIIINRHEWATWGYRYQTSTGSRQSGSYDHISSWAVTLNIRDENHNKYICAYGQTWWYTWFICSTYPVKVDISNPSLSLDYPHPSISYDFKKWTDIRFVWSWSDDRSGMSGYVFDVVSPSGVHDPHNFGSNTTAYTKNLNEAWRRYWIVTGYDNVNHQTYKSWSFYVSEDWDIPENWFYLVSPALWTQITLWNDVVLSWQPGTLNSWYNWTVKKISWTTIATWTTTWLSATISSWEFTTWAYSWSVKDIATNTTKSISLFYVVDSSDTPDLEVNQFEFNEIEDADLDEYYSSNKITIRWLSDEWYTLAYLWSWIWALYINWEFVWTSGYVQNGDKINIEMKASDEYNETVKTTLFVWMWSNAVSGDFKITTQDWIHDWDDPSLTPMQKLWWVLFVDNLVEMYQYDEEKLATFLSTFMQLLQDKSDYYASMIQEAEEDGDEELAQEYRLYKEAIDFLYLTVKYRYNHLDVEDRTIYIAPNGKQYLIEYDEDRMAYTSPDFSRPKYFPTWELLTNHIDLNNPAVWKWWIVWNVITTHNGKVYTIYEKNWKWTSSNFKTAKYFDTKEDIINHILANNPASDWDHRIDTDFDEVSYTAPNGKVYKIFKTSSKWNNPNMYSSYNFVDAKYFTSLEAAKKFIDQNNKK